MIYRVCLNCGVPNHNTIDRICPACKKPYTRVIPTKDINKVNRMGVKKNEAY